MITIPASDLAQRLNARPRGRGNWLAFCPSHSDGKNPSLSIGTKADGSALISCLGGCTYAHIARALEDQGIVGTADRPADPDADRRRLIDATKAAENHTNKERNMLVGAIRRTEQLLAISNPAEPCDYLAGITLPPTLRQISLDTVKAICQYHPGKSPQKFVDGPVIIAPIYNRGRLYGCQLIDRQGQKPMLTGSKKKSLDEPVAGSIWSNGKWRNTDVIFFGEGIRSVLSMAEGTDYPAVCVLDHSGFQHVLPRAREKFPYSKFVVGIDINSDGQADELAIEAAIASGSVPAIPDLSALHGGKLSDWNDLHRIAGIAEVHRQMARYLPKGGQ